MLSAEQLLHSPWALVLSCGGICIAHVVTDTWFRGRFANCRWFSNLSHFLTFGYAVVSACHFFAGIVFLLPYLTENIGNDTLWCGQLPSTAEDAGGWIDWILKVYFWCKLWECMDLITVTLRGYPVIAHFRWHHYTTPIFGYFGWASRSHHGALFLLLNTFMHAMAYVFHSFPSCRVRWLHRCIRSHQNVQLFVGTVTALLAWNMSLKGTPCSPLPHDSPLHWTSYFSDIVPALLFTLYFTLFRIELRDEKKLRYTDE